jgi:AcrR family transcriptional regulator
VETRRRRSVNRSLISQLPGGLRKQPLQERSKAAIRGVLDSAAELVLEQGTQALIGSPTLLLERSGISRGSFYAFFDSPERVLDELALQCMQDSRDELVKLFAERRRRKWTEIVDVLSEQYWGQYHIPLVRELWVGQHLTSNIRTLDRVWAEELADLVLDEFQSHAPQFRRLTFTQCIVAVEILERLSQYAFRDQAQGDPAIKKEARSIVMGYFATFE